MKKLVSLILAIMMIAAVGVVFATSADDTYTGSNNTNATSVVGDDKIPLIKGIVFFNANGSNVYEPNVTFSYGVAPATIAADGSDATVTDDASTHDPAVAVQRNVYPGPNDGVTGTTISFSATNAIKSSDAAGAEVEKTGNLTLDIMKFSRPGIYRYLITETVTSPSTGTDSERLQAAGLTERGSGYDNTRYLDVYIRNKADGSGLEMYGAVIFKTTGTSGNEGKDSIDTATKKTTGFEPNPTGDSNITYANDPNVDKYYTYDFSVKKTVSGSMADTTHEFPFFVSVTNSIPGAMFTYQYDGTENFNVNATAGTQTTNGTVMTAPVTLSNSGFAIGVDNVAVNNGALKLKHNDTIKLIGVPSNQTTELAVVVKEFNDTYDQYTASTSVTNGTLSIANTNGSNPAVLSGIMTASTGSMITSSFDLKSNDTVGQILTINNNLTEISPTGYVSRFAPYALILVGGIILLIISKKHKKNTDED